MRPLYKASKMLSQLRLKTGSVVVLESVALLLRNEVWDGSNEAGDTEISGFLDRFD